MKSQKNRLGLPWSIRELDFLHQKCDPFPKEQR
jgi:hypothetical protein